MIGLKNLDKVDNYMKMSKVNTSNANNNFEKSNRIARD